MTSFKKSLIVACAASVLGFGVAYAQTDPNAAPATPAAGSTAAPATDASGDTMAKPMKKTMKKHAKKKSMKKTM